MPAAIVPIKLESERVPRKNFRKLGPQPLWHHLVSSLVRSNLINDIYIYCSDEMLLENMPDAVKWLPRDPALDSHNTTASELFLPAVESIKDDIQVITHVTSPFIRTESIDKGLSAILSGECDSSFSVEICRKYSWMEGIDKPLNYDTSAISRTQDLRAILLETSGFYAFRKQVYLDRQSRIGSNPKAIPVSFPETLDIDTEIEFRLAETIVETGLLKRS